MFSYYNYELDVEHTVATRLQSPECRLPLGARGELDQETLSRHYRAYRTAQRDALKSQVRIAIRKFLNSARILLPSLFHRSQGDAAG